MRKITSALTGILLCALVIPAQAQTPICFKPTSGSGCTPVSAAAPLPVTSSGGSGGAVTLASGAVASGAYSSGAYAAGALAAGAFAVGAGVDGWDLTQGARADAAWTTGSGSVISLLKAIATADIVTNRAVNVAQINGITPLMGNGVTGTGSPRVTIASDNTAFPVNATLSAETTKVIGTVNQGTSPWVTSATQSGTWNITNISGTISLPTGAATSALQTTMNATLGSPFQAGGAIGASENHIGEVGGNILPITNTMTTANATTAIGQSIGGLQTLSNAVRVSGSLGASGTSGIIQSAMITFKDAVGSPGEIDVYYFNANPTGSTCTNNVAFALVDADRDKVIGIAKITDMTAGNTAAIGQAQNLAIPFGVASGTTVYSCVVVRAAYVITGTANASLITRILRN